MSRVFSSLRFRLILVVLLAVLPAIVLILYTGFEHRTSAAAQAQENMRKLVEMASMHQARMIEEAHRLLAFLSEQAFPQVEEKQRCSAYLAELLQRHSNYLNLGIIGADGQLLCSAVPFEGDLDLSDRDYFQRALKEDRLAMGSSQIGRITGMPSISFGYPVKDVEGRITAVAFAAVDLAWLTDLALHVKLPKGATLTVVDSGGAIAARYPEPERWVGKVIPDADIFKTLLSKENEGLAEAVGIDGVRRLYAFTHLDDNPHSIFLYTGIPTNTVYGAANRALTRNLIALGLVSILALLAAHLFGHLFVMRGVNALVRTAQHLAGGDLSARTHIGPGSSELNELGSALDEMADSLERRAVERDQMEEALRMSEAKYRSLVEQIPVVTYIAALDEAHTTLYMSPQVESLLGFDQEDFTADPNTWSKRLFPEDRERVLQELASCQTENDLFINEYRMLTFHGNVKWIRDEAVIVLNDAREPLFIQGVMIDITEQKKIEEALRNAHDELETRVEQRTQELARANEDLRQHSEELKFFAYSVVHDLKSPAIGAYGLTRLFLKQYIDVLDEKARRYCDQIMKASEHIAELVDKINIYIATKETPIRIESFRFRDVLQDLREEFFPKLNNRSIKWIEPDVKIGVRADRLSILRVFRNYIDNALKYGGEQLSEIRIGYQELEEFHVFSVSDDGQGVNEKDGQKIFQMFHRNSSSSGVEGAGLGLAIVKEIAERHRGKAWMESSSESWTTFYLSIAKNLELHVENCQDDS